MHSTVKTQPFDELRNIAIIAHVDHGKTTLIDGMLKQTDVFRANQQEMQQTTILDSNDLEREKGITILAKNTAVSYADENGTTYKINIIDTPGHADFAGEVERVISMADGALLIVDAAEGPLPQTRFVLQQALKQGLRMMVLINKIDRSDAEPERVLAETEELFLQLATNEAQLDFPVLYGIGLHGVVWNEMPAEITASIADTTSQELPAELIAGANLIPLFKQIITTVPKPVRELDEPFRMLVSHLDFDAYKGTYAIGRVAEGTVVAGDVLTVLNHSEKASSLSVSHVFASKGIEREQVVSAGAGDIIALAGNASSPITIGQTLINAAQVAEAAGTNTPELVGFPMITITPPALKVQIAANTSPLAGREGEFSTPRQIEERLHNERRTNLGLEIEKKSGSTFVVAGRGELHLAVLIETMRREGYEFEVGRPEVIFKEVDGELCEPYEELSIEITGEYMGVIVEELGRRQANMQKSITDNKGIAHMVYHVSSRNILGFRSLMLTKTRGEGLFSQQFLEYRPLGTVARSVRSGVLVATEAGEVTSYALESVQQRGTTFVSPGQATYEGMIIGLSKYPQDIEMNIIKQKKLTNFRANADIGTTLAPPKQLTLEESLTFIAEDELLEVTPLNLRLRKRILDKNTRAKAAKNAS